METLQLSVSRRGGLALHNLCLYYYAVQLVYIHWWLFPQQNNAASVAEVGVVSLFKTLGNLIYKLNATTGTVTLKASLWIYNHCLNSTLAERATYPPGVAVQVLTTTLHCRGTAGTPRGTFK